MAQQHHTPRLATSKIAKLIKTEQYPNGCSSYFTNYYKSGLVTAKVIIPSTVTDEQLTKVASEAGAVEWHRNNPIFNGMYRGVIFSFRKEQPLKR